MLRTLRRSRAHVLLGSGLDSTRRIRIVEANPGKFKLPAGDLQERKVFVQRMRESVQVKRVSDGVRKVRASFIL